LSAIFLSHSSWDASVSQEVAERLRAQGHRSVFLDFDPAQGIPAGRDWEQELYHRLRACQAVIVLCSEHSMASHWCFAEITHAKALGKQVFPVKVAPCTIDPVLTSRQILDLTTDREEAYQRLWRGLRAAGLDPADAFDWDGSRPPYPGLMAFQEEDAGIYFGREDEIHDGLQKLRRLQRFADARMLLVLGASGSGKSSLVRAGLLPRLRRSAEGWIVLDPFRPGEDPFRGLAGSLAHALADAGRPRPWQEIERSLEGRAGAPGPDSPPSSGSESVSGEQNGALVEAPTDRRAGQGVEGPQALSDALDALETALRGLDDPEAALHLRRLREVLEQPATGENEGANDPAAPATDGPTDRADRTDHLSNLVADLRLGNRRPEAKVLVTVDQFEELFGQTDDHPARAFLRFLRTALEIPDGPVVLLATMRSDSLGDFQKDPELVGLRFEGLSLGPMAPESVAQTIDKPARAAGVDLEPGLTEALVDDARGEESLPLLAFTLRELWERFGDTGRLTVRAYRDSLGGLCGSVARAADEVLATAELSPETPDVDDALRRAFLQMVRITASGRFTRQPARWRDLPSGALPLVERFVHSRLLVLREEGGERIVEVAHEALFRSWQRLRDWLDQDREFLLWRRRLRAASSQWSETGRDDDALLRGGALAEAERWLGEHAEGLDEERAFIEESAAAQQRRLGAERRRRRRILTVAVGAAVVFLALAAVAFSQYLDARRRALEQQAGSIVKTATTLRDPLIGTLLLLESADLLGGDEPAGGAGAARQIAGNPDPRSVLRGHEDGVSSAVFSPDDRWIVTASEDGTARVWRSDGTGEPQILGNPTPPGQPHRGAVAEVTAAAFSPDGGRVVTASRDGIARIWTLDGATKPVVLDGEGGALLDARFSHDGARIVTANADGTARIWQRDGSGGTALRSQVLRGHNGAVNAAVFSPNDAWIATASADGTARLWRAERHQATRAPTVLAGHTDQVLSVAFSPDGTHLVTASRDGTARVWDLRPLLRDRRAPSEPVVLAGHEGWVWKAVFSHDGRRVATASADNTARLWHADGPLQKGDPVVLRGHKDWVRDVAFSPDDTTVLTASHDGTARLWRVDGGTTFAELAGHKGWVRAAAFSHGGRHVVTASDDGTARIWNASFVPDPLPFEGHTNQVWDARLSHDGRRLVSASADRTARIWAATGAGNPIVLTGATQRLRSASFSPDDTKVLTSSDDGTARIWDAADDADGERDQPVVLRGHTDKVLDARWSHDGTKVVTASYDRTIRVWDTAGHQLTVLRGHKGWVRSAVFSRDDRKILSASADRTIGLWNIEDLQNPGEPTFFRGHEDQVMTAAFSPDGKRFVSASADLTVRVWNTDGSGEPLVLEGHEGPVWSAAFSPDGTKIVSASQDWTARVWNADGHQESGEPVFLEGHQGPVWSANFGPEGRRIVTASADGVVRIYRLWSYTWPALVEDLDQSTNACLTPIHRSLYLMEPPEVAQERYAACERAAGR